MAVSSEVEKYLQLPYCIEVIHDGEGLFARVVELPGCMTQAETWAELGEMIEDAMRGWLEVALEDGDDIPLPKKNRQNAQ